MFADRIECLKRHWRQTWLYKLYMEFSRGGIRVWVWTFPNYAFPKTDSKVISGVPSQCKNSQGGEKVEVGCVYRAWKFSKPHYYDGHRHNCFSLYAFLFWKHLLVMFLSKTKIRFYRGYGALQENVSETSVFGRHPCHGFRLFEYEISVI